MLNKGLLVNNTKPFLLKKGNILHQTGRKGGQAAFPQQVSSSERSDRIKNSERTWACGFGRGPDIVKNRLISTGSHSHTERGWTELGRARESLHLREEVLTLRSLSAQTFCNIVLEIH